MSWIFFWSKDPYDIIILCKVVLSEEVEKETLHSIDTLTISKTNILISLLAQLYPGKKKRKHEDCSDEDEDEYDEDDESVEDSDVHSDSDDGGMYGHIFQYLMT